MSFPGFLFGQVLHNGQPVDGVQIRSNFSGAIANVVNGEYFMPHFAGTFAFSLLVNGNVFDTKQATIYEMQDTTLNWIYPPYP